MAFLISAIADNFSNPGGLWEILILGLFDFVVNYGWRIVLFTICLKLLLLPLDLYQRFKMRKNQIITERLQPQLEKLQQQYAGDKRMLSQKQMELNRKEGFSYFSSCLPMIVTLVIFFYLFSGLNNISHFRIFEQYVELYDAYTVEETEQKKAGRTGIFNAEEIDKFIAVYEDCDVYFGTKAPNSDDYKVDGEWATTKDKYTEGEGDNAVEYTGGEALYRRALKNYNDSVAALEKTILNLSEKKAAGDSATVSWNDLQAWRVSIDATEPTEADYKNKFGDKKGEWIESDAEYIKNDISYHGGEAEYRKAKDAWQESYLPTSNRFLELTDALYKDYILQPAQEAAVKRYGEVEESFLWISNIWSPDVPWRDAILDYDNFISNISDYGSYKTVREKLDAKENEEFNRTVFDNMLSRTSYNRVTGLLRAKDSKYNVVNGYLILPILSVGLSFLSQFITSRLQKKSGQAAPTGGMAGSMKMMMVIMPVMMGIFALSYTAMFTLYIVINSGTTILINVITTLAMNGGGKNKTNKALKSNGGIQKYGRPDPKDL